jgi:hypothetical protein
MHLRQAPTRQNALNLQGSTSLKNVLKHWNSIRRGNPAGQNLHASAPSLRIMEQARGECARRREITYRLG